MVPIVHASWLANVKEFAPPHSFIHVDEFPNLRELAAYINYLDSNDTAYAAYFAWKDYGSIVVSKRRKLTRFPTTVSQLPLMGDRLHVAQLLQMLNV